MSRKVLGLDIRSSSASAVLMEGGFKKSAITGYAHAPFPREGGYQERLTETLTAISREMDLKDCVCAMSVPSNRFFYRNVSVPFGDTKKIHQMLPYELESVIPFPVDDLLIDFNKIPPPGADGQTRIIAAGIETERLKLLLDTVEACGIMPTVVFPCGYAMAAWVCRRFASNDAMLFVDYDGENCSLYLLFAGEIALIRSFSMPLSQAKSAIHLWGHIQRSIAGFESLFELKVSPAAIFINGFPDPKFPKQLETVSSVSVVTLQLELPANFEVSRDDPEAFSSRSSFNGALSCGLYLLEGFKGMNFRKGPLATKNRLTEYRDRLIRTSAIAGIVILLWLGGIVANIFITQNKVDQVQAQITEIFKTHFPNNPNTEYPVHQMRTQMETLKKAAFGSTDIATQVRSIDLLRDISRSIPADMDVQFSKFVLAEDGVYIDGTATSYNLVDEIKTKIENIEEVASVTATSLSSEGNLIRFKLRIETRPEETS